MDCSTVLIDKRAPKSTLVSQKGCTQKNSGAHSRVAALLQPSFQKKDA